MTIATPPVQAQDPFGYFERALAVRNERLQLLSSNIANADTPNFKARDLDFAQSLDAALKGRAVGPVSLARTDPRHIAASGPLEGGAPALYRVPLQQSADGNTVEMDSERVRFADTVMGYQSDLYFVSDRVRTLLAAVQSA